MANTDGMAGCLYCGGYVLTDGPACCRADLAERQRDHMRVVLDRVLHGLRCSWTKARAIDAIRDLRVEIDKSCGEGLVAFEARVKAKPQTAEVRLLRAALEFYADPKTYETPDDGTDEFGAFEPESHLIFEADPGGRARAALAGKQ